MYYLWRAINLSEETQNSHNSSQQGRNVDTQVTTLQHLQAPYHHNNTQHRTQFYAFKSILIKC